MRRFRRILVLTIVVLAIFNAAVYAGPQAERTTSTANKALTGKVTFYTIAEWTSIEALKPYFKALVDTFKKLYPGADAEVLSDPFMTWMDKYQVMFAAGNSPDVNLMDVAHVPAVSNAGYLMDLGPRLGNEYFTQFVPGVLAMYTWQGKHFATPYTMDTRVLYYNKDLFKKAGLNPEAPPRTWAEYLAYAKALTRDSNGDGRIDTYGNAYDLPIKEFTLSSLYCASAGTMVTVDQAGKVKSNVDTPEFRGYLKLMADLRPFSPPDFATLDGQGDDKLFVNGKLGMRINGSWILDQNPGLRDQPWFGQSMIPRMSEQGPDGSYGAGFGLGIPAGEKNPELALAFLKLIMSPEFNSKLITNPPPSKPNLAVSEWAKDPIHSVEIKQFATTRQPIPGNLYLGELNVAEQEEVSKVIFGAVSIDQAVAELQDTITRIVSGK
jgi:multiple sugar transport system substrate-binding protein